MSSSPAATARRCPPPERIIINYAVRALIDLLSSSGRPLSSHHHGTGSSSRAGASRLGRPGRALMETFGPAGSTHSLNGLAGGAASPAPSPAPVQPHNSSSSEHWQQQQAAPPAASHAAAAAAAAAGGGSGNGGSSAMQRAASAASTGSVDAGAALAGLGLPGLTDSASTRSRLGQPAGNSRTPSDATRALGELCTA